MGTVIDQPSGQRSVESTRAAVRVMPNGPLIELIKFQTTFGRRNADVTIDDPDVSRQHAVIEHHGERYLLKDLESTNGTRLNGSKTRIDFLKDGDVIRIGSTDFCFLLHPSATAGVIRSHDSS